MNCLVQIYLSKNNYLLVEMSSTWSKCEGNVGKGNCNTIMYFQISNFKFQIVVKFC